MNIEAICSQIRDESQNRLDLKLSDELKDVFDHWMESELIRLAESTAGIPREEVRVRSLGIMFGKRFDRAIRLLKILERNELLDRPVLFDELLRLM